MIFTALTVAGSDSSGGAGIQADLQTFARIGVYGMSVIVALTAQNTTGVAGVLEVPAEFVGRQWDAVLSDISVNAVKTGMLGSAAIIEMVAGRVDASGMKNLVVDPVMVSTSGTALLATDAIDTLKRLLLPRALLVTPNMEEAKVLTGVDVRDVPSMEKAARQLQELGTPFVLVKGGHLAGDAIDVLYDGTEVRHFRSARVGTGEIHGTGCVLSAAVTAYLARGNTLADAVRLGKDFVSEAIASAVRVGKGSAVCNAAGLKN